MRIVITLTEEPVYLTPFIREVIERIPSEICHFFIVKGTLVRGTKISEKIAYLITLGIISGPLHLLKRIFISGGDKIFKFLPVRPDQNPFSIVHSARALNIPYSYVDTIESEQFLQYLRDLKPDIIINQAQAFLKKEFLDIPKIGCLNRHCGLLPKYRGRLAPFWAYLQGEKNSGVSIHFIDEKIDNGPILIQKIVPITRYDTFDSVLDKDFALAPQAMLEAIELIRDGQFNQHLIQNNPKEATYFSSPRLKDAITYRKRMFTRSIRGP